MNKSVRWLIMLGAIGGLIQGANSAMFGTANIIQNAVNSGLNEKWNQKNFDNSNYWNQKNFDYMDKWNQQNFENSNMWNEKNYQAQQSEYQRQQGNQLTTWQREDNAVQRRVADLKAAGLSPTLAAGSAAATSAPISLQAPQRNYTPREFQGRKYTKRDFSGFNIFDGSNPLDLTSILNVMQQKQQIDNTAEQNKLLALQGADMLERIRGQKISNDVALYDFAIDQKFGTKSNSSGLAAQIINGLNALITQSKNNSPARQALSALSDRARSGVTGAEKSIQRAIDKVVGDQPPVTLDKLPYASEHQDTINKYRNAYKGGR